MKVLLSHLIAIIATAAATALLLRPDGLPPSDLTSQAIEHKLPAANDAESGNAAPAKTALPAAPVQTPSQLELEIQWLQTIIEQLEQQNEELTQQLRALQIGRSGKPGQAKNTWFDEDALLEAGFEARDFADLQQRVEYLELQKLETTNRATREGWTGKKEYYQTMRDLEQQFRNSLSPAEYDIYLFATGKPNRVSVSDVLANSAANLGGIQSGDIILNYAGEAVYDPSTLYRLTTQGQYGEMIAVTLQRDDETIVSYLPRGPLGTRFKPERQAPTAP